MSKITSALRYLLFGIISFLLISLVFILYGLFCEWARTLNWIMWLGLFILGFGILWAVLKRGITIAMFWISKIAQSAVVSFYIVLIIVLWNAGALIYDIWASTINYHFWSVVYNIVMSSGAIGLLYAIVDGSHIYMELNENNPDNFTDISEL